MNENNNKHLTPLSQDLRKNMTKEEKKLWYDFLKKIPYQFNRQKVLGKYIADFYCAQAKLVVELDGSQHYEEENQQKDKERDQYLSEMGVKVLRFSNLEMLENFKGVCSAILIEIEKRIK
ncbi:MAG: endonuclease domain-containing protein [Clostridia bacterium]|nr:endonuclease domain-containing protein [Clostridia bacterium]